VEILGSGQYYPMYSLLLSLLDPVSIIRLSKTCRRLVDLYRDAIPREWNVDRLLGRFVEQPLALRSVMRDHRVVISGSAALQFFERRCWKESDLDVFVQKPSEAKALKEHLVRTEGYRRREASVDATQYHFGAVSLILDSCRRPADRNRLERMFGITRLSRSCVCRGGGSRYSRYCSGSTAVPS